MKKKVLIIIGRLSNSGAPLTTLHFIETLKDVFDFDILILNVKNRDDLQRYDEYEKYCKKIFIKNFDSISLISHSKNRNDIIDYILGLTQSSNYNFIFSISGLISIYLFKKIKLQNNTIKTIFYSLGPGAIRRKGVRLLSNAIYSLKFKESVKYMDYIFYISNKCVNKSMLNSGRSIELIDYPDVAKSNIRKPCCNNTLGILATISRNKNQLFCIKLLKYLNEKKDFKLIIMGNVIEKKYLDNLLKKIKLERLDNKVCFISGNDNKINFFKQIDFLLLPSKREGLPLVLLESQYLGIPCISSLVVPESANIGGLTRMNLSIKKWSKYLLKDRNINFSIRVDLKKNFNDILYQCFGATNEN